MILKLFWFALIFIDIILIQTFSQFVVFYIGNWPILICISLSWSLSFAIIYFIKKNDTSTAKAILILVFALLVSTVIVYYGYYFLSLVLLVSALSIPILIYNGIKYVFKQTESIVSKKPMFVNRKH